MGTGKTARTSLNHNRFMAITGAVHRYTQRGIYYYLVTVFVEFLSLTLLLLQLLLMDQHLVLVAVMDTRLYADLRIVLDTVFNAVVALEQTVMLLPLTDHIMVQYPTG